ncbi:glutathione S-transferase family protein [Maritimibacter dapengensis]|uniref:Glutathione S-transferase family protein n=1 Tax=Maritimibacter dapengensis TaxID=2836868 RepID=A0ABS6T7X6_9RHOB|nr:glutathione S-transferase family protein [Maritimibacter dapengensis]MBV7380462.1 glutathione S-transferase family protein [Maritimibacter dapengensis]
MGHLDKGEWKKASLASLSKGGDFKRSETKFRNWVTPDGAPGPTGEGGFPAESGRYHLYVSYACPWAHRTLIFRSLKGLEDHIGVSVVHPDMLDDGWTFDDDFPGATGDTLMGKTFLREVYTEADPKISGRVTVPILWDTERNTIVSNESAEIIRMFNSAFDEITGDRQDFYPEALRGVIDTVNKRVYDTVNNGVYKSGFATSQEAYDAAVTDLFDSLDWLEDRLSRQRYLAGDQVTEADWRLLTTLLRFDLVYHGHFKCNRNRLVDMPNLWAYARELYQWPGVAETDQPDHYHRHYHYSHESVNPYRIIPIGPDIDWTQPHGRDTQFPEAKSA